MNKIILYGLSIYEVFRPKQLWILSKVPPLKHFICQINGQKNRQSGPNQYAYTSSYMWYPPPVDKISWYFGLSPDLQSGDENPLVSGKCCINFGHFVTYRDVGVGWFTCMQDCEPVWQILEIYVEISEALQLNLQMAEQVCLRCQMSEFLSKWFYMSETKWLIVVYKKSDYHFWDIHTL